MQISSPRDRMLTMKQSGRISSADEYARIIAAELVPAPSHVADMLDIAANDQVIRRERISYRNEYPVSISVSWFSGVLADIAPDLLKTDRIASGTPRYIEQQTGRLLHSGEDLIMASMANETVAAALFIEPGAAIVTGCNLVRDSNNIPIEFGEFALSKGHWFTYSYKI